jgi:hypothetical protein
VGAFAVGTAAIIVLVGSIEYENWLIRIEQQVPHGDLLQNWMADIMYDVVAHSWYEVLIVFLETGPAIINAYDQ